MRAKKVSTAKIAAALGYEKIEIERWQTLSVLPMDALILEHYPADEPIDALE